MPERSLEHVSGLSAESVYGSPVGAESVGPSSVGRQPAVSNSVKPVNPRGRPAKLSARASVTSEGHGGGGSSSDVTQDVTLTYIYIRRTRSKRTGERLKEGQRLRARESCIKN